MITLLGYDARFDSQAKVTVSRGVTTRGVRKILTALQHIFERRRTETIPATELGTELSVQIGCEVPTDEQLDELVALIPGIERLDNGLFRRKFDSLNNMLDRCEWILRSEGRPLSYRQLTSRIRERDPSIQLPRKPTRNPFYLWVSSRFVALGKTGTWGLKEWEELDARTIAEIALDYLGKSPGTMRARDLLELVRAHRIVRKEALNSILRTDARFRRVRRGVWAPELRLAILPKNKIARG